MRFGVREICNVVFKTTVANQRIGNKTFPLKGTPVIYFDSLKTSSMEQATTTVYATGGRGNTRLIAWEGEKTLTFTMEDALISEMGLAILSGAGLYKAGPSEDVNGNTLIVHVTEDVTATGTTFKVTKEPADTTKSEITFYALALDSNGELSGEEPIAVDIDKTTKIITPTKETGTTLDSQKVYKIDYYIEKPTNAYQIDIEPQSFGGNFYIEADTLFRDTDGADHAAQFIIPNGKVQSNFTLSMASSGDPSTFTFTVDAFPGYVNGDHTKKVMSSIQIVEDDGLNTTLLDVAGDIDTLSI